MFSSFPDGWPGTGLVLLRLVCGVLLAAQGAVYLLVWSNLRLATSAFSLLAVISGVLLVIGCWTRTAALVAAVLCASGVFSWLPVPGLAVLTAKLPGLLLAAIAAAVFCLGPGAFSLDALIFGRREVVIPTRS